MFNIHEVELEWAGRPLKIQTGKIARQAHGAVVVSYGDTMVLATVVAEKLPKPGVDFFPLSVHYQEKAYAAGKIPGGFFKREGRPSEKETLTSRLIDRPIRPLFPSNYTCETQVLITVLSHDMENDPDIPSMIATSAALTLSGVPFFGPIGGARVALINDEFVINPSIEELKNSDLDLVVAGTNSAVLMVESEAKELNEETMLEAVVAGQESFKPVIDSIIALAELAAKEPRELIEDDKDALISRVKGLAESSLRDAYKIVSKTERQDALDKARKEAVAGLSDDESLDENDIKKALKHIESDIVRTAILETGKRIDGRDLRTVRPIEAEVGILPRSHGSALFTRGETQALVVATLGTGEDEQFIDALEGTYKEPFMLHYNFPPYSVGEAGRVGATGRREIGHGKLAWRAVKPMLPSQEEFPYTLRVVSEITESNGSSSMATVCGTSLSLMDAGVPLERPIAGIAMGLIKEGENFAVLSDILGDEDHLGDMDFKVAGTEFGVTSLQMDIKITGITSEIMKDALDQAREGRLHILGEMSKALNTARDELGEHAPKISQLKIPVDKIRDVIGTGGKVIREIVEKTGAKINVSDEGLVKVASSDASAIEAAISWITSLTSEPVVGEVYEGKVVKIMEFGAFVNFFGNRDGLVHISQLAQERINSPHDIVNEGDMVKVKMIGIDDRGKVRLSMKVVNQETGEVLESSDNDEDRRPPRRERNNDDRGGNRGRRRRND